MLFYQKNVTVTACVMSAFMLIQKYLQIIAYSLSHTGVQ